MQQLESGKVWGLWWLGEPLLSLAGVHVVSVLWLFVKSPAPSPCTVRGLCWYQGMCHTGSNVTREKVLHRHGVWEPGRQTSGRDQGLCLWARNDNKGWEMLAIFERRREFLSLFVIPGLKLTDCSSLSSPLRVSPEYHCQSAAACFPYLSKSGQKYPPLNICQTQTPAVTSVSSVPSGATDNWGCGEQLWPCIGWWWPGGWPLTNIYNIVKISVTAPQTTAATYQPTIFTAESSWNSPQSWLIQIHIYYISFWCSIKVSSILLLYHSLFIVSELY